MHLILLDHDEVDLENDVLSTYTNYCDNDAIQRLFRDPKIVFETHIVNVHCSNSIQSVSIDQGWPNCDSEAADGSLRL